MWPPPRTAAAAKAKVTTMAARDDDYDDIDHDRCDRCGGEGFIEYDDAGPDVWGEDCPSEVNHLVKCPDCNGTGERRV